MTEVGPEWGRAAVGQSGKITINVDEAVSGPERWQLEIESPQLCVRFSMSAPSIVTQFRDFLDRHFNQPSCGELNLQTFGDAVVSMIKDDEFDDRFCFRLSANQDVVGQTIVGEVVSDYITALSEVVIQIDER